MREAGAVVSGRRSCASGRADAPIDAITVVPHTPDSARLEDIHASDNIKVVIQFAEA
jgi:hypothetical protein